MMHSENHYCEHDCSGCCPDCILTTQPHCAHCPQYGRDEGAQIPEGYDYSHLVGSPAKQGDKIFDAARFDGLLTDYDRTLLEFGMGISWHV
jgi:hypothetical protein